MRRMVGLTAWGVSMQRRRAEPYWFRSCMQRRLLIRLIGISTHTHTHSSTYTYKRTQRYENSNNYEFTKNLNNSILIDAKLISFRLNGHEWNARSYPHSAIDDPARRIPNRSANKRFDFVRTSRFTMSLKIANWLVLFEYLWWIKIIWWYYCNWFDSISYRSS